MSDGPHADLDPALVSTRSVELAVMALLLCLAIFLGWDNWRLGAGWAPDGPQPGYFPFYLAVLLGGASLWGIAAALRSEELREEIFVGRSAFGRVLRVFLPTIGFVLLVQLIGLYVASFVFIAAFMVFVGRLAVWKSLLTGFVFSALMFYVFDVQFNVLMPKGPLEAAFGF
ncbi:tripartite tricarboxylate transporter TctB family protein [Ancylobacter oerskovii]|uniref:Tripartite tricarboxylate transporter TctB family protein n=1 Tax=Ancylobacter oerskovii TaxID=459519 RepID=A0ABW4YTA6_9HYPH|nr:tripartite tricarboxylate transporter TctB family protein [Ancylobacter oerskovii]MBS7543453.1 tripartite tricarboxylate transporter TctB family protein [Ancylobacter oerskovii]